MKLLIVPDVHGRDFWRDPCYEHYNEFDKIIFLGDYLDHYRDESTKEHDIETLKDIISFKKEHLDKVILLIGNHDCPYIWPDTYGRALGSYWCRHDNERHDEIAKICSCVKEVNPETLILVDNCYGEFTEEKEPIEAGADLIAGSLIKNPGGGLAPAGGYIAGKSELVEKAAMCLTTPGIGGECGATLGNNRLLFQGLYFAPHCVCQAMKTAVFCAAIMEQLGMETSPAWNDKRSDIIQAVSLGSKEKMVAFCKGIQSGSAVDSYVSPEPWNMPGYDCEVIMAAGNFIQGASLELSADGPVREPYTVYRQGGLTYEAGKLGIMNAVSAVIN